MKKIIITFDDEVEDIEAIFAVESVVKQGRISMSNNGACYCFVTTFANGGMAYADKTKSGTDTFRITKPTGQ